ncbi:MAG: lysophospholipase [Ectothiorhodospiraceae bacterium]
MLAACAQPRFQDSPSSGLSPHLDNQVAVMEDGYRLPYWRWLPEEKPPRAVILALHGFNDYRNAFSGAAPRLAAEGFAIYAYDQRGFGQTSQRGLWPGEDRLVADAVSFGRLLRTRYPDAPLMLLGDSMGGAVSVLASQRPEQPFDGSILVAPAVWGKDTMSWPIRAAMWLTVHTFPGSTWTGRSLDVRPSDNAEMLRSLGRDANVIKRTRADTIYGLSRLMSDAEAAAGGMHGRVLVLVGKHDEIVPRNASCRFLAGLPNPAANATVAVYPQGYHMLLRDLGRAVVVRDIIAWLEHRPLPSGNELSPHSPALAQFCKGD